MEMLWEGNEFAELDLIAEHMNEATARMLRDMMMDFDDQRWYHPSMDARSVRLQGKVSS